MTEQTKSPTLFKILIVDDETAIAELLTTLLKNFGHDAIGVTEVSKALELLQNEQFDLLLTDLKMPDMNGIEVVKHAKRYAPHIKTILFTGWGYEFEDQAGLGSDIDAILPKPFGIKKLTKLIQEVMDK